MIFLLGKLYRFLVNKYFNNFFIRVSKEKFPKVLYSFFYLFFVFSPFLIAYAYYFLIRAISYYYVVPIVFLDFSNTIFTPFFILYFMEIGFWIIIFLHAVGGIVFSRKNKTKLMEFQFLPNVILKIDNDHKITKIFRNLVLFLLDLINLFIITLPYTAPVLGYFFLKFIFSDKYLGSGSTPLMVVYFFFCLSHYIKLLGKRNGNTAPENSTSSSYGSNLFKGIIALGLYNKAKENRKRRERNRYF